MEACDHFKYLPNCYSEQLFREFPFFENVRILDVDARFDQKGVLYNYCCVFSDDNKPLVKGGYDSERAVELLKTFYKGENPNAPEEKRKPARS